MAKKTRNTLDAVLAKIDSRPATKEGLEIPPENQIYFWHTGTSLIIPVDPDSVADTMGATFASSSPLSRSAPIFSYSNSGPRTVQFSFTLHRDLCKQFNPGKQDSVDLLIKNLEQCVLPDYNSANKIVNPPIVSVKLRDEIYIRGVVNGSVSKNFKLPIINYSGKNKYALVDLSFAVTEIAPYSASIIGNFGPYRP